MKALLNIEKLILRILYVLIVFLFSVLSVSANSISYEEYSTYSSCDLKIAEEIISYRNQNLKNAITVGRFTCKSESDLVDYKNWAVGVGAVAAKTVPQYTKSSLKLGQQMHKGYKVGADGIKEFRLPSGKRIDFLDIKNSTIYELKPFNPRAMQQGQKQLNMYMQELQTMPQFKGINWKTVLDTY
jgi:hypothetical protein